MFMYIQCMYVHIYMYMYYTCAIMPLYVHVYTCMCLYMYNIHRYIMQLYVKYIHDRALIRVCVYSGVHAHMLMYVQSTHNHIHGILAVFIGLESLPSAHLYIHTCIYNGQCTVSF